jgi:hypothetical protein
MVKNNKSFFIFSLIFLFFLSFQTVNAVPLGGSCGDATSAQSCDQGLICEQNTYKCVIDPNSVPSGSNSPNNTGASLPSSLQDVSGRGNTSSGSGQSKCDKPGDEFCPAPKFCYINGLCVPAPEAEAREGSLRGAGSIFEVIAIVLKWLLTLAGVIATVFLIFGGYQYITAGGNEEQSEKGKQTLINAVIGIVIVLLSMTIITIVTNTLSSTGPLG